MLQEWICHALRKATKHSPVNAGGGAMSVDFQTSGKLDFLLAIAPHRQAVATRVGQFLKSFRYRAPDHILGKHTADDEI